MTDVTWAADTARKLLADPLPQRWSHTQGVAARARDLTPILGTDVDLIESAAWLHDIGYSPGLVATGFHPLDGARFLRDHQHAADMLCRLVAHHSYALIEAEERGLDNELSTEFEPPLSQHLEALTYCDMTTSAFGEQTTVHERIADILARYGDDHLIYRVLKRAKPHLVAETLRIEKRLATS